MRMAGTRILPHAYGLGKLGNLYEDLDIYVISHLLSATIEIMLHCEYY